MPLSDIPGFRAELLRWFTKHQRDLPWRRTSDPFHIWVSEVMLQQTQVNTVIPYYQKFISRFPTIEHLAVADQTELLKLWEGLGYYARARNFQRAAKITMAEYGGRVPDSHHNFHSLPGVGDYIAAAVQSIAFDKPFAAVDGNVKRVLARLLELKKPVNDPKSKAAYQAEADILLASEHPGDFNQAMMELGALVCSPGTPVCSACPVQRFCQAFQSNSIDRFPRRLKKKPIPIYHISVGIVLKQEHMLITLRKSEGLLGGLWEFPGGKVEAGETAEQACIREIREETALKVSIADSLTVVHHAYTHFKIRMSVFVCRYKSGRVRLKGPAAHKWIRFNQIDSYPFPGANHKIFPKLEAYMKRL